MGFSTCWEGEKGVEGYLYSDLEYYYDVQDLDSDLGIPSV